MKEEDETLKTKARAIVKSNMKIHVESPSLTKKKVRKPRSNYYEYAIRKMWARDFLQLNPFPALQPSHPYAKTEIQQKKIEMLSKAAAEFDKQYNFLVAVYSDTIGTIRSMFDRNYNDPTNSLTPPPLD